MPDFFFFTREKNEKAGIKFFLNSIHYAFESRSIRSFNHSQPKNSDVSKNKVMTSHTPWRAPVPSQRERGRASHVSKRSHLTTSRHKSNNKASALHCRDRVWPDYTLSTFQQPNTAESCCFSLCFSCLQVI